MAVFRLHTARAFSLAPLLLLLALAFVFGAAAAKKCPGGA